ncbi:MAG: hypothetical protein AAF986_09775 [Pseudomonadota bacterium]
MRLVRTICCISGIAQAVLFYALLTDPEAVVGSFGVATSESVAFLGRWAAMLFLGLSALSFYVAASKIVRFPMTALLSVPWLGLAATGFFEYQRGYVGGEIFPALATEVLLGLLLLASGVIGKVGAGRHAG